MPKWRKLSWILLLFLAGTCGAQDAVETNLYLAFNKRGPIVLGKIVSVNVQAQTADRETGMLTMEITEHLRGDSLPPTLDVKFDWVDPNSPGYTLAYIKRPPPQGFDRLRPAAGMHVLAMFSRRKPAANPPLAVLNLDSGEEAWVPHIKRAVAMDSLPGDGRTEALLTAMSDSQKFIRVVAMQGLLEGPACQTGSLCRDRVVKILAARAGVGVNKDRLEAIDWLTHRFYDAPARETTANIAITQNLLALTADPDKDVRGQAIDDLDQILSPDLAWHPDLSKVPIPNRDAVMKSLQEEQQKGGVRGDRASRLATAILGKIKK
jgi:hypothetical protein